MTTQGSVKNHHIVVYVLFFASGISALVYEIVWIRELTYHFGASILAVSTVLAAFMGGLALGSWAGGSFIPERTDPLLAYAWLELGIGASALCMKWALNAVEPFYLFVWHDYHDSFVLFSVLRFFLNFSLLLIPTAFMGATLPVLSRTGNASAREAGYLYAVNVFGSVLGCVGAGFIGIPAFGLSMMVDIAAGINLAVGLIAFRFSSRRPPEVVTRTPREETALSPSGSDAPPYPRKTVQLLLVAYGLSGMTALGYQVLWNRSLVFAFDYEATTTYVFTAMLGVLLAGLAAGSALMSHFGEKIRDPLATFSLVQALLATSAVVSLFMITVILPRYDLLSFVEYLDPQLGVIHWPAHVVTIFASTCATILPSALLMGMSFPLAVRSVSTGERIGYSVGRVYLFNTLGAIVGAFITGFVLMEHLGIARSFLAFALVNIAVAVALLLVNDHIRRGLRMVGAAAMLAMSLVMTVLMHDETFFDRINPGEKLIFYKEGPLDTVYVSQDAVNDRMLYVDTMSVAGTSRVMLTDQKTLAHLPMLIMEKPRSALAFGFGSGGTSWSFLLYPELERMDVVEISPTVPEAAPYLEASNHGLLREPVDPRFHIIRDDARNYLRAAQERYDIIEIDCTDLRYKENAGLYSLEFFDLSRKRLTEQGVVTVWMPLGKLSIPVFTSVLRTFHRIFPFVTVWYFHNEPTHYVLLLGSMSPHSIDYRLMQKRLEDPGVRADLAEIGLEDPVQMLGSFVTDQDYLERIASGALLNTEDFPYVEFYGPRYEYSLGNRALVDNRDLLMNGRKSVFPYLRNIGERERKAVIAGIERIEAELPGILSEQARQLLKNTPGGEREQPF